MKMNDDCESDGKNIPNKILGSGNSKKKKKDPLNKAKGNRGDKFEKQK